LKLAPEIVLIGYGNPGRGDDALGPMLIEAVEQQALPQVECLTDMQLQIEHVTDLENRRLIIFADADAACAAPFEFTPVTAARDDSYSSHAMSPAALLYAYRQVHHEDAPTAYILRIRGYDFGLGAPLSGQATGNLHAAATFTLSQLEKMTAPHLKTQYFA